MRKKSGADRLPIIEWIETYYIPVFLEWLAAMGTEDKDRQDAIREELAEIRSKFPYSAQMASEKAGLWVWIKSLLNKSET